LTTPAPDKALVTCWVIWLICQLSVTYGLAQTVDRTDRLKEKLMEKLPDSTAIRIHHQLALLLCRDKPEEALQHAEIGSRLAQGQANTELKLLMLFCLGHVKQYGWRDEVIALRYYHQLAELAAKEGKFQWLGKAYYRMAIVANHQNHDQREAIRLAQTGLDWSRKAGDSFQMLHFYNLMGELVQKLSSPDKAEGYLLMGYNLADRYNLEEASFMASNLGDFYRQTGKPEEAIRFYQLAADRSQTAQSPELNLEKARSLGYLYHLKKEYSNSNDYLQQALDLCTQVPDYWFSSLDYQMSEAMAENYAALGQGMKAYKVLKKAHQLRDSLQEARLNQGAVHFQSVLEAERHQYRLSELENESNLRQFYLILTLSCVGLLTGIVSILFHSNSKIQRHNIKLAQQQEEIVSQQDQIREQKEKAEFNWQLLKLLIDQVPAFIALLSQEGRYALVNKMYETAFLRPLSEIEGQHYRDVLPEYMLGSHVQFVNRGLSGETAPFSEHFILPNGQEIYSLGQYTPVHNVKGEVEWVAVVVFDVTELKKKEEELGILNQTKDHLISVISHDFRSPLTSLKSMFALMSIRSISEKEKSELLGQLEQQVDRTLNFIDNLLVWVKKQSRGLTVAAAPFKINDLLEESLALFARMAQHKSIHLQVSLAKQEASELMAQADCDLAGLVLNNLLSNAIKFTPSGGIVTVSVAKAGHEVVISVKDTGKGIHPEKLSQMLEGQLASAYTKGTSGEKGTGLGLALSIELAEKNGGKLQAESTPGTGSTFSFTLPRCVHENGIT
jgi:PAS domain S-box-containing protein